MLMPDHTQCILTSKEYASEHKFIDLAMGAGKYKSVNGEEIFENPFKPRECKNQRSFKPLFGLTNNGNGEKPLLDCLVETTLLQKSSTTTDISGGETD